LIFPDEIKLRFVCSLAVKVRFIYLVLYLIFIKLNMVWMNFGWVMSHVR